jgi:YfiH family protein
MTWRIEGTAIGRIVVPPNLPDDVTVLCTSSDFEGRLNDRTVDSLSSLLRERFAFRGAIASCGQVHGAAVAAVRRADGPWQETPSCDALVSTDDSTALAIKIADCLPIAVYDAASGHLANIHSGWRGAAARVVPEALETLRKLHGSRAESLRAWLGPSIRVCCFEVGEEVVDAIETAYGETSPFVDRSRGRKPHVDLPALTARILRDAGVDPASIDDSGLCTRCEGSIFHSFRRDGERSGRNLMVIGKTNERSGDA